MGHFSFPQGLVLCPLVFPPEGDRGRSLRPSRGAGTGQGGWSQSKLGPLLAGTGLSIAEQVQITPAAEINK